MGVVEIHSDRHGLGRPRGIEGAVVHPCARQGDVELGDLQSADDIAVRAAFSAVASIDATFVVGVSGRVVARRSIAALQIRGLDHIVPACADATGAIERRDQGIVLYQRVEGEGLASACNGMAVAHDGAQLTRGVVRVAGAIALVAATIVNGAARPSAPVGVVGPTIVPHFVGDHVQVPSVGVQVVGRGGGEVAADPGIETVAQSAEVGDAPRANVGSGGEEVLEVQGDGVEVRIVVPFRIEGPQNAATVIDHGDVGVRRCPDVKEAGVEGDEVVEFVAVDLVHRGQNGEGPVDRVFEVRSQCLVAELVHFNAHLHAFQKGR